MSKSHDLKVRLLLAAEELVRHCDEHSLPRPKMLVLEARVEDVRAAAKAIRDHDLRMP